MIPLTILYDEYTGRSKLTEEKSQFSSSATKVGLNNNILALEAAL